MNVNLIVCIDTNYNIGKIENDKYKMCYDIKEDLKAFKNITSNSIVIMGRKTYESIGQNLQNRINVIISNNKNYNYNTLIYNDLTKAIKELKILYPNKEIFIIGGKQIYELSLDLNLIDNIYLGEIHNDSYNCDIKFFIKDYMNNFELEKVIIPYCKVIDRNNNKEVGYSMCLFKKI